MVGIGKQFVVLIVMWENHNLAEVEEQGLQFSVFPVDNCVYNGVGVVELDYISRK